MDWLWLWLISPQLDSSIPHQFSGDFNSLTVPQLKAHCKLRGLQGYSKQLKADLVQRLNEYTNPTVPPPPPTTSTLPPPTEEELQYEKYEATLLSPTEEELQLERDNREHLWNEEEQLEKQKRGLPPDAQRRLDEHQNEYYAALFGSDESDELEDGLGVYVPKEPIGEVCAICLEVQSGLGEVVGICGHGFHKECIKKNKGGECPHCREPWIHHRRQGETEEYGEVIILLAGDTKAKKMKVGKTESCAREEWFPPSRVPQGLDRLEICSTQHKTGDMDYYIAFCDGHSCGDPNPIAKWIARKFGGGQGVPAKGNFVIAHKVQMNTKEFGYSETNGKIDKNFKQLKELFTNN